MRYTIKFEEEVNADNPEEAALFVIERLRTQEFSVDVFEGQGKFDGKYIKSYEAL